MTLDYNVLKRELLARGLDFDSMADKLGKPIEEQIKPLLLVLNHLGYKTVQSCEGHTIAEHKRRIGANIGKILEEDEHHLILERDFGRAKGRIELYSAPWVVLKKDIGNVKRLKELTTDYNSQSLIPWGFLDIEKNVRFSPEYNHRLSVLQAEIPKMAEFLFSKY